MQKLNDVHLLKPGNIPLPNGEELIVDAELLTDLVNTYDPDGNHEAPLVLGHDGDGPRHDGIPAVGWLKELYTNAQGLFGNFEITSDLADWIKQGLYKKRSLSFYPADSEMSPVPGKAYVRHVALLGGEPPVVKGLLPFTLSEVNNTQLIEADFIMDDFNKDEELELNAELPEQDLAESEDGMTTEKAEEWLRALLADGAKGYKDEIMSFAPAPSSENNWLIGEDGTSINGIFTNEQGIEFEFTIKQNGEGTYSRSFKPADVAKANEIQGGGEPKAVEPEAQQELGEDCDEPMAELGENYEEVPIAEPELGEDEPLVQQMSEMQKELAELKAELAEAKAKAQKQKDEMLMGELRQFTEKLYADGKLLDSYADKTELSEFMFGIAKAEKMVISLSESGKKASAIGWFKNMLSNLPKAIELSELATAKVAEPEVNTNILPYITNASHDAESAELYSKVIALCERKGLNYKDPAVYTQMLKEAIFTNGK